jgi:hypothetical protein
MAKVSPYHTNSTEYPPKHREVYHDKDTCPDGKRIKPEHRLAGTGEWVAGLDHAPQAAAPSAPRTFNEVWQRYKKLKEESGAWGKHHVSTLRAVMNVPRYFLSWRVRR